MSDYSLLFPDPCMLPGSWYQREFQFCGITARQSLIHTSATSPHEVRLPALHLNTNTENKTKPLNFLTKPAWFAVHGEFFVSSPPVSLFTAVNFFGIKILVPEKLFLFKCCHESAQLQLLRTLNRWKKIRLKFLVNKSTSKCFVCLCFSIRKNWLY